MRAWLAEIKPILCGQFTFCAELSLLICDKGEGSPTKAVVEESTFFHALVFCFIRVGFKTRLKT
jgi:hypothetical protein